jgi:voltage-gated sodium channel
VVTTFAVLNLFIGIVVNAMQSEHDAEMEAKQQADLAEIREEQLPLIEEIRQLRAEVKALRGELAPGRPSPG